jgi:hypothetical protein
MEEMGYAPYILSDRWTHQPYRWPSDVSIQEWQKPIRVERGNETSRELGF